MAPPQKPKGSNETKQKTLTNWFSKPQATNSNGKAANETSKAPTEADALSKTRVPQTPEAKAGSKGANVCDASSPALGSTRSDASSPAAKDTPPTSDPIDVDMLSEGEEEEKAEVKKPARGKRKIIVDDSDEEFERANQSLSSRKTSSPETTMSSPSLRTGRTKKPRVSYVISDEEDEDDGVSSSFSQRLTHFKKSPRKARSNSSTSRQDDDDDFIAPSESELTEARSSSRASGRSSSAYSEADSESDVPKKKSKSKSTAKSSAPVRPSFEKAAGSAQGGGSGNLAFLTKAEQREQGKKDEKKKAEDPFGFLQDVRDKDGVRPGEPNYDPRTLYIPKSAWKEFTPFEVQFWEIKQNHFDTILFFQKGKFLELYEDDARIGHQEFDLKLTQRVKMSMVGVPESSFSFWAAKFLGKGYKVGRVDQAETALGAEMRLAADKKGKKSAPVDKNQEKIVRRELNKVYTNGTLVDAEMLIDDQAGHCLSIRERGDGEFGICVLDSATSEFKLSTFDDDVCRTKLETLIRQLRVKEVVYHKGNLSVSTTRLLKATVPAASLWTSLRESEGFGYDKTIEELKSMYGDEDGSMDGTVLGEQVPQSIRDMLSKPAAIEALGAMVWYLRQLNIDKDIMTMKNFNVYDPMKKGEGLVLDGQTLAHIEVLLNDEGTEEGSLLKLLGRCITPFGKRLFRIWLCMPLRDVAAINARLDAVQTILDHPTFEEAFTNIGKGLPDLERIVSRVHAKNCKIKDFVNVLKSFKKLSKGMAALADTAEEFDSKAIFGLLRSAPDLIPNIKNVQSMYQDKEDMSELHPEEGKYEPYDDIIAEIAGYEKQLDKKLKEYERQIGCSLTYWHSVQGNKEIYLVQTKPNQKNIPNTWIKSGSIKAAVRWQVPELGSLIRSLKEARETRNGVIKDFKNQVFAEFDADRAVWLRAIRIFAELDCLFSLAKSSSALGEPICRPDFVEGDDAWVDFEELRHPALVARPGMDNFIPNDVKLGGDVGKIALLTGPNMGGKSTIMRMTAAGVIMAQLGMMVPARKARLSPVDSILTRMGAYDNMFSNASTFKVELDECCKILRDATPKSLVILDELGRGTSTYDGMAIAGAVLHQLATHTLSLSFFATHYGSLTDDFAYHPNIRNMHMSTHVDDEKRELVFLYKLVDGVAESSFGTHVASLAGVPIEVVERAEVISKDFAQKFKEKMADKQKKAAAAHLPLEVQADFAYLYGLATGEIALPENAVRQREILRRLKETVRKFV